MIQSLTKIKSVKKKNYKGKVHDIEVSGSHTYTINNISVHNSSAGSLVCYLLDITKINPLQYGLIFERFIDVNRFDPPDVDSDIPDNARQKVLRQIEKEYGIDNVKTISTFTRMQPVSAIGIFAKGMDISPFETEMVKDDVIERSAGDSRAHLCLKDTFETTDIGREFIEKYPEMKCASEIEGHAKSKGKHAAGIIVCNDKLTQYCGVDERDQTVYLDKRDAEKLNLLKIDILGLRTLAVLESYAKLIGMDYNYFYTMPLDDEKAYEVFKEKRLAGIFQFDGDAMASINDAIPMENFNDIIACAALGRPGALASGGTSRYIQLRKGEREPVYYCDKHKKITEETYGIIVFQEQMMFLLREVGGMSWEDVSSLRKAAGKSLGSEYFERYKIKFVEGAIEYSGYDKSTAELAWLDISSMGGYAFNKSHSVAYGMISYWCAYCKAHNSLEFVASNLNNEKEPEVSLKILREFYEKEHLKYTPVEPYKSGLFWEIKDGELIGGLTNIVGIGTAKGKQILKAREEQTELSSSLKYKLNNPKTPFDILYPVFHHFGKYYKASNDPDLPNLSLVSQIQEGAGVTTIIGKMIMCEDHDMNDSQSVAKRGGEKIEGPHRKVHVRLQDDTGAMMCILGRYKYDDLSAKLLRAKVGDTYFVFIGKVMKGAKILLIDKIANLSAQVGLNPEKEDRTSIEYKQMVNRRNTN